MSAYCVLGTMLTHPSQATSKYYPYFINVETEAWIIRKVIVCVCVCVYKSFCKKQKQNMNTREHIPSHLYPTSTSSSSKFPHFCLRRWRSR